MANITAHTVSADGLFDTVFRQASRKQSKAMLTCFLDQAQLQRESFQGSVNNQLNELRELINGIQPGTGGISDERLETLFQQLMSSPKMAALFSNACMTVNGVRYSNASIIKLLLERPQVVKTQYISSETDPTIIIGAKLELTGNREAVLNYSVETLSEAGATPVVTRHKFSTTAWPAADGTLLSAEAYSIKEAYASNHSNGCGETEEIIREQGNFVFEMGGVLQPCVIDNLSADLDVNGDGTIGTPAEPPVDGGTTEEPPVDGGTTEEPPVDGGTTEEPPVDGG